MAVPDPDAIFFQYFGGGGAAEIAPELTIDGGDWEAIAKNDAYEWSLANRRTFWSFYDADNPLQLQEAPLTGAYYLVAEGFWSLSEGRDGIIVTWDAEDAAIEVTLWTLAGAVTTFSTTRTTGGGIRTQGSFTWTGLRAIVAGGEGYFSLAIKPLTGGLAGMVHGFKIQEQRIAQVDL